MFKLLIQFLLISNLPKFAYSTGDVPEPNPPGQIDQNEGQTRHRNLLPLPDQLPVLNPARNANNLSQHSGDESFINIFEVPIPSAVADEDASASFAFPPPPMPSSSSSLIDSKGKSKVIEIEDEDEQRIGENMPQMHSNQAEQVDPALEPYQKEIFRLATQIDELEKNLEWANNLHSIRAPDALKNPEQYGYRPDLESEYVVEAYELQLPFLKQILPLKRNIVQILGKMIRLFPLNPQLADWINQKSFVNGDAATMSRKIGDREKFCENYRQTQNNGRQRGQQQAIAIHQPEAQEGHQRINPTYVNAPGINIANNPPNQQIHLHGSLGRQMAAALIAKQHHQRHQPMHGPMEQKQMRRQPSIMPNQIPGMHSSNMGGAGGSSSAAGGIIAQMQHAVGHQGHQLPTRLPLPTATVAAMNMNMQHRRLGTSGSTMSLLEQHQQHLQRQNLQQIPLEILRAEMARRESQMQMENSGGGSSSVERGNIPGGSSGNAAAQFRLPPAPNFNQHQFKQFSPFHHMQEQIHQLPFADAQWHQLHSFAHPQQNLPDHPSAGSDGQQGQSAEDSNFNEMAEGSNGNKRTREEVGGEDDEGNKRMRPPSL